MVLLWGLIMSFINNKNPYGLLGMGRIGRLRFLSYNIAGSMASVVIIYLVIFIAWLLGQSSQIDQWLNSSASFGKLFLACLALGPIIAFVYQCLLIVRRLHDLGWSGWWLLIHLFGFLPFALIFIDGVIDAFFGFLALLVFAPAILFLVLLFTPGKKIENAYGQIEPPPSVGKHWAWIVFGSIFSSFFMLVFVETINSL